MLNGGNIFGGFGGGMDSSAINGFADDLRAAALSGDVPQIARAFRALEASTALGIPAWHPNFSLECDLSRLREISRYTLENNALAGSFLEAVFNFAVGSRGLRLEVFPFRKKRAPMPVDGGGEGEGDSSTMQPDVALKIRIEREWAEYCRNHSVDSSILYQAHRRDMSAMWHLIADGEFFLWFRPDAASPWGFHAEIISPERVPLRMNGRVGNRKVQMGIEFADDGTQRRTAYYAKKWTPGDYRFLNSDSYALGVPTGGGEDRGEWIRIPAAQIRHVFLRRHSEQMRGIPHLSRAIYILIKSSRYEEAALLAAFSGAQNFGFLENVANQNTTAAGMPVMPTGSDAPGPAVEAGGGGEDSDNSESRGPVESVSDSVPAGQFSVLRNGYQAKMLTPNYPASAYPHFMKRINLSAAQALGLSYPMLTLDFSDTHYSALKAAILYDRQRLEVLSDALVSGYLFDEFRLFLESLLITRDRSRRITRAQQKELLAMHRFSGPVMPDPDSVKGAKTRELDMGLGLVSPSDASRTGGATPLEISQRSVHDKAAAKEYGHLFAGPQKRAGGDRGFPSSGKDDADDDANDAADADDKNKSGGKTSGD